MAMVVRSMMVGTNLLNPTAPDNLRKASITSVEASQKSLTTLRRDIDLNVTELRLPDSALGDHGGEGRAVQSCHLYGPLPVCEGRFGVLGRQVAVLYPACLRRILPSWPRWNLPIHASFS